MRIRLQFLEALSGLEEDRAVKLVEGAGYEAYVVPFGCDLKLEGKLTDMILLHVDRSSGNVEYAAAGDDEQLLGE